MYTVDGFVYPVHERYPERTNGDEDRDWYEYQVNLSRQDGSAAAEWDSLFETYNGVQQLTEEEAHKALAEFLGEMENAINTSDIQALRDRFAVQTL